MTKVLGLLSLGLSLVLLSIALRSVTIDMSFALDGAEMRYVKGHANEVPMKRRLDWPWQPISDNSQDPRSSGLVLFEDERLIGSAHAPYDRIETIGGGDYVHWGNSLFFSTADHSDPRSNGRRYHGTLKAGIAPRLLRELAGFGGLLFLVAIGMAAWIRRPQMLGRLLIALFGFGLLSLLGAIGLRAVYLGCGEDGRS